MRLLVTGIGGFVGRRLARMLVAQGDEVVGTYLGEPPGVTGVQAHEADLLEEGDTLERLVAEHDPEAVVHLGGLSHVGGSWGRLADYFQVNVLGTERVLAAAAGRRVVVASSAEVYGAVPEDEQPIAESRPLAPGSPYALTKASAERLAVAAGAVVVRPFNLIGPGQSTLFALPSFASQLAAIERGEREAVLRVGNLAARRDFVHVDAGARAYRLLAERGEAGGVYNIAAGRELSIRQALERLMEIAGVEARIEIDEERMRPIDQPLLMGDSGRLRALGWEPGDGVDDALGGLWQAARADAQGGVGQSRAGQGSAAQAGGA